MTNARPEIGTGAVMAGGHDERTASDRRNSVKRLHVELHRNTARLHGGRVLPLLDLADIPARMYDRQHGCWTVPIQYADDVICAAEYRQRRFVTVEEVTR